MNNSIMFKHYAGIEYHGLMSQEVQKILDATKGDILKDYYLSLVSEWNRNDATGKRTGRKETYTLRITRRDHYAGTDEDEMRTWQTNQAAALERIVQLIEEHLT